MYGSSLLRCFSLFKFIFVEHIIKRRSLKNTIGRIKIHERTPTRYREISTQTSPDDIFTGATLRVYERTPAFSRNVSTRSSNNGLCACITSRNSQCSSGSMSDSSMVNKSMKNERHHYPLVILQPKHRTASCLAVQPHKSRNVLASICMILTHQTKV